MKFVLKTDEDKIEGLELVLDTEEEREEAQQLVDQLSIMDPRNKVNFNLFGIVHGLTKNDFRLVFFEHHDIENGKKRLLSGPSITEDGEDSLTIYRTVGS